MTAVIVAPRIEDPLSDVEAVASSGYVRIRPSVVYTAGGQWVLGVWSAPIPLAGSPLTFQLDPLTDIPYELHVHIPDGTGGDYDLHEFRTVTASGVALKWEDLVRANGPGAAPAIPSDLAARVAVLEAAILVVSGGASTVGAITDMSAPARTFNKQASYSAMRTTLGVPATGDAPTAHQHPVTDLTATGTKNGTKFLRDDNTWVVPATGGAPAWVDVTGKPASFPTTISDITGDSATVGNVLAAADAAGVRSAISAVAYPAGGADGQALLKSGSGTAWGAVLDSNTIANMPPGYVHAVGEASSVYVRGTSRTDVRAMFVGFTDPKVTSDLWVIGDLWMRPS